MPQKRRKRPWIVAMVLTVIVLGSGIVTYLLGGMPQDQKSTPEKVLAPQDTARPAGMRPILHLDRGNGEAEVGDYAQTDYLSVNGVFVSGDYVVVADRVTDFAGTRVRWFDAQGALAGMHMAPAGSTLVAPCDGGFSYVISKDGGDGVSETAVLYTFADNAEKRFTIPLRVNSGALWAKGGDLYARIDETEFDEQTSDAKLTSRLVPVAKGGVQVDDATAEQGIAGWWGVGLDGAFYSRVIRTKIETVGVNDQYVGREGTDAALRVPTQADLVGADAQGNVYVYVNKSLTAFFFQDDPARLANDDPQDLVFVGAVDGSAQKRIAVPHSPALALLHSPVTLSPKGLVVAAGGRKGLDVYLIKGVR